jgi:hypothetical protein
MNDGAFELRDRLRQERGALVAKFNAGGSVDALLHGPSAATAGANCSRTPTSTS